MLVSDEIKRLKEQDEMKRSADRKFMSWCFGLGMIMGLIMIMMQ